MIDLALPRDWSFKRLKHLATYNDEVLAESTDEEKEIDYVEISGVSLSHGIEEIERTSFGQAPSRARRKVRRGDILISTVRTYLRAIAKVDEVSPDLIASTGFCVVRPNDDVDSGFLGWAAKSEPFVSEVVARSVGVSYPAINASELVTIYMPLPPLDTQRRIAQFLDEKTARIDGLIAKKRELLDRLAEKRLALITRAVTKGLNLDALMKSSGIDWLGGMTSNEFLQPTIHPAEWKSIRLRWLSRRYAGGTPDTKNVAYWEGGTIPWLNSGAVNQRIITEPSGYITELALKESSAKWIPRGALVIALAGQGKTKAMVGYLDIRTTSNQSLAAVLPEKIDGKFLYWWLSSQYLTLRNLSSQDGRDGLNLDMIGSIVCPVPPPDTQRRIARFLDEKTVRIDGLIDKVEESQNLLEEYRSALITQAVTGQLAKL